MLISSTMANFPSTRSYLEYGLYNLNAVVQYVRLHNILQSNQQVKTLFI